MSTSLALAGIASAASNTIVISQVYGGGGNTGATYNRDFIELHNISTSAVTCTNWSVQYASSTGISWTNLTTFTATIQPGAYLLIGEGTGAGNGIALPTVDVNGSIAMGAGAGKIALVNNNTALTGANPAGTAGVIDLVGYGTGTNGFEGTGPVTPNASATTAALRANSGTTDTDNNPTDLSIGPVLPRNSATAVFPADIVAPTLAPTAPFSPADEATGVAIAAPLTISFSEGVHKVAGNVTVKKSSDNSTVYTVDVLTPGAVTISPNGLTATINLPGTLTSSTSYYVNVDNGAFADQAGIGYAGISDATTWNFTTGTFDVTPPSLVSVSPADDSTGAAPLANLVITFDDAIVKGTGDIVIKKSSDNSIVETIPVGDAKVSVAGAVATINPATTLDFSTGYYVEVAAGAFADNSTNGTAAISGATAWNFTTKAAPTVLISQYYEGVSNNRFVELQNLTGSPLPLDGYRITVWSNTAPSTNQLWKTGTDLTDRNVALDGYTIPANGHLLIAHSGAAAPTYAVVAADLKDAASDPALFFNGDDSVVLYQGETNALGNVVDAVSFVANTGADTSFYRLSSQQGFDFSTGSSIADYSAVWATRPLADVASAAPTDAWYLSASAVPESLSISFNNTSFSEAAGPNASTATVTRTGPITSAIFLNITVSDESEVSVTTPVTLPANQASTTFPLNAVDDSLRDGNKVVTITVDSDDFIPAIGQVTVNDDGVDPSIPVVINEVDSDSNPSTDPENAEFIELYNTSNSPVSLDGHVIVLYNGNLVGDPSYRVIDLSTYTIPAHDYFVIGNPDHVANVDLSITTNEWLQNGADAVVLRVGVPAEFPDQSALPAVDPGVVDAVVYDTADADDTDLLSILTPGQPQIDEGDGATAPLRAIARVPDGGLPFVTTSYVAQFPTPGVTNGTGGGNNFAGWAAANGATGGINGDPDHDGIVNLLEYALGFDPDSADNNPAGTFEGGLVSFLKGSQAVSNGDLTYKIQTSTTLAPDSWIDASPITNTPTVISYQLPNPTPTQQKIFARLVVTQNP